MTAAIPLGAETIVGVLGSGAMGAGIAQVAALRGHAVVLADVAPDAVRRAREAHVHSLAREVEKARLTRDAADAALGRIIYVPGMGDAELARFAPCGLVIEAIVEDLRAKQALFRAVGNVVHEDAVLATNTSSLLVAAVGATCARRERVLGIHFFNPVPVMPLVEVIPALTTDAAVADSACALAESWNKIPVRASDTPGFIVNRVARPFYGESLRIFEEGIADCAT
ncbi:MAG TPA: 3-hydroxyacyl-CoA dehydrogenase NAD-binding domain-containing protein, partial [Gemmatimonadaceae bacterium]|nr:3-hydroxyacyl-CoA dehydrogenase NAD-binding domain-containing protein [Gemmatimonadaceae bacterium]